MSHMEGVESASILVAPCFLPASASRLHPGCICHRKGFSLHQMQFRFICRVTGKARSDPINHPIRVDVQSLFLRLQPMSHVASHQSSNFPFRDEPSERAKRSVHIFFSLTANAIELTQVSFSLYFSLSLSLFLSHSHFHSRKEGHLRPRVKIRHFIWRWM